MRNDRTINSFLAAPKSEDRKAQLIELDLYVQNRLKSNKIIKFLKYWGASNKSHIDKYDFDSLITLLGFMRIIEHQYQVKTHLTLIFTNTHAFLNGYSEENYSLYFNDIRHVLNSFNYSHCLMSEILTSHFKTLNTENYKDLIDAIIKKEIKLYNNINLNSSLDFYRRSAEKYSLRYCNRYSCTGLKFATAEQAAEAYIILNQIEISYVEILFPNHIFLTYVSKNEQKQVTPNLPTIQIFSYRPGIRSRPWFSYYNNLQNN